MNDLEVEDLLTETLALMQTQGELPDDAVLERTMLEARIMERSDELGEIDGTGLVTVDDELLCVCFDRVQAQDLQRKLMLAQDGIMTLLVDMSATVEHFIHPAMDLDIMASCLLEEDE